MRRTGIDVCRDVRGADDFDEFTMSYRTVKRAGSWFLKPGESNADRP